MCDKLNSDLEETLYPKCTNFFQFSFVLRLLNLKAKYRYSDKNFIKLLELLEDMLPSNNTKYTFFG